MRNIVNPEVLGPFLNRLVDKYPRLETYIKQNVKQYILKKENTFISLDDACSAALMMKNLSGRISADDKAMYTRHGILGKYLKLNLNEDCFKEYAHYLDYAQSLDVNSLSRKGFQDLKREAMKVEKRDSHKKMIEGLKEGEDFRLVSMVGKDKLYKLITLKAYQAEGQAMNHCVGSFVKPNPEYSIYSLRNVEGKALMTVSVSLQRQKLHEAAGRFNSPAHPQKLKQVLDRLGIQPLTFKDKKDNLYESFAALFGFMAMMPGLSLVAHDFYPILGYAVGTLTVLYGVAFIRDCLVEAFNLFKEYREMKKNESGSKP